MIMECESPSRGIIKNVIKMGEECDELTPVRQWVKSVSWMRDRNTMESVRTYKNGTKC